MKEQKAAAKVLGVKKVEFLGYKDGHLAPDLKLRQDIVRMIRKYKPELVITHIPGRVLDAPMGGSHPDHLAVGEATMAAVYPDSRNPRAFRSLLKQGYEPHEVKEVWIPFWTSGDYLVDISSTLDQKITALRKHKSQVSKPGREWDFEKFMRKRHGEVGKRGGYKYAESFKRITVKAGTRSPPPMPRTGSRPDAIDLMQSSRVIRCLTGSPQRCRSTRTVAPSPLPGQRR
jgi:LmbE family N-acetylglucosaminyl deacetylase